MSHRMYLSVVSLGSVSLGLLAASSTLHTAGCGPSVEEVLSTPGACLASPSDGSSSSCFCSTTEDCPTETECARWSCEENHCKAGPPAAPPVFMQVAGDCKRVECTAGEKKTVTDDDDLPTGHGACISATCTDGKPDLAPRKAGTLCAEGQNSVCNDLGICVRCLETTNEGCGPNEICHKSASDELLCVHHCFDGTQNAGETDKDCGGTCKTCDLGKACSTGSDCKSQICASGLGAGESVCCEVQCADACKSCVKGTGKCEDLPTGTPDTECNQQLKVCAQGAGCVFRAPHVCLVPNDCMSHICFNQTCFPGKKASPCLDAPDCLSGVCGGDKKCAAGAKNTSCFDGDDCVSGMCESTTHTCQ